MHIDFENLDANAKIYIYPSNQKFHPNQLDEINNLLNLFTENWSQRHTINASATIKHQRFIIFGINDETPITTEILDEMVGFILEIQMAYDVVLIDKLNVCFKQGAYIQYKDVKEFKTLIKNKSVNKDTIVFDNLINTKEELDHNWEIPASESWYNRMF